MADMYPALQQDLGAKRNPIAFLCDSTRAAAEADVARGALPRDVADQILSAADFYEPVVADATIRREQAQRTYRPDALLAANAAIAGDARKQFASPRAPSSAKLWSEINTTTAAATPTPKRYQVGGKPATVGDMGELNDRLAEIRRYYDAGRPAEKPADRDAAILADMLVFAARGDDEPFLAYALSPIVHQRDAVRDDRARARFEEQWLKRAGTFDRVQALKIAAGRIDRIVAAAKASVDAFAGPDPNAPPPPKLRALPNGELAPIEPPPAA